MSRLTQQKRLKMRKYRDAKAGRTGKLWQAEAIGINPYHALEDVLRLDPPLRERKFNKQDTLDLVNRTVQFFLPFDPSMNFKLPPTSVYNNCKLFFNTDKTLWMFCREQTSIVDSRVVRSGYFKKSITYSSKTTAMLAYEAGMVAWRDGWTQLYKASLTI